MRVVGVGGATRTRSRAAVLRGPGATRLRSLPPSVLGKDAGQVRARTANEGLPQDRPEAPTPHDLTSSTPPPASRPAHAANNKTKQKHIQSRPGSASHDRRGI